LGILIFTDNPTVFETQLVLNELRERGIETHALAPWDVLSPEFPEFDDDMVYVPSNMLNRGSTFELVHRLLILQECERQIGTVVNPIDSMLRYSKEYLTMRLTRLGLPSPRTLVTENVERAYEFSAGLLDAEHEVVLKPLCRGRGVGVTLLSGIRTRGDLLQFLAWYNRAFAEGVFYLQEYVPNLGHDVRCLVVDGEVVGREKRSNPNDFRYNVSAGGSAEPFEEPIYDDLAIKVTEAVGFKVSGIDVLPGSDGTPYVLEANCFPGYAALIQATGIPIHKKIVDYFQRTIRK
jgi:ribosomal protein S6--L-glutamate ligase/gamma-F420-2:alpha-L-glutamate ligase